MNNKYIVLKKMGAVLPSRRSGATQRDHLKEKGQSLTLATIFLLKTLIFPKSPCPAQS